MPIENIICRKYLVEQRGNPWVCECLMCREMRRRRDEDGDKGMVEFKGGLQAFESIHADTIQTPEGEIPTASASIKGDVEI